MINQVKYFTAGKPYSFRRACWSPVSLCCFDIPFPSLWLHVWWSLGWLPTWS